MNDIDDVLVQARDSLAGAHLDTPVEAILARSRSQRHKRWLKEISAAAIAASFVLALGLAGVFGSSPVSGTGAIRAVAFTITRNANGTSTLTISPRVLFDPSTLQRDLARHGIPAKVTTGRFCSSDPAPSGFSQVVTESPALHGDGGQQQVNNPTVTINPAIMPAGTELSIGAFQVAKGYDTALALLSANSYTCTTTAPTAPPSGGALLHGNGSAGA
jgi:hypothetical protein